MPLYRNILNSAKTEDFLEEALAVARYINTRAVRSQNPEYGDLLHWDISAESSYDDLCMYAGASGIGHFYLELYRAVKGENFLTDAKAAGNYLIYRWKNEKNLGKNFSPWAFSTGYSGAAFYLIELYEISKEEKYKSAAVEICRAIIASAQKGENGRGYTWGDYPGIVGDAGIMLFLMEAGKRLSIPKFTEFGADAAEIFLDRAKSYSGGGIYYLGVKPEYFGSGKDYIDPNFPMGAAGIGYTLLKAYEVSGRKEFLDATDGLLDFFAAAAIYSDDKKAALLPHGIPSTKTDVYYLGYCHGPSGTARFFYELYKVTKSPRAKEWEEKIIKGLLYTGAPEVHSAGYWNIYCYCCGTTGMMDMFLGEWACGNGSEYLEYARRCGNVLLGQSIHFETKEGIAAKWNQAFTYADQTKITANIGLYDGAAGMGWLCLQYYLAAKGKFHASREIDAPYPEEAEFQK